MNELPERKLSSKEVFLRALSWVSLGASAVCLAVLGYCMLRGVAGASISDIRGTMRFAFLLWFAVTGFLTLTLPFAGILLCCGVPWDAIRSSVLRALFGVFLWGLSWCPLLFLVEGINQA